MNCTILSAYMKMFIARCALCVSSLRLHKDFKFNRVDLIGIYHTLSLILSPLAYTEWKMIMFMVSLEVQSGIKYKRLHAIS